MTIPSSPSEPPRPGAGFEEKEIKRTEAPYGAIAIAIFVAIIAGAAFLVYLALRFVGALASLG
jgi:hypothetical protein